MVASGVAAGWGAVLALSGCMADVGPERPRRMPTVLPAAAMEPKPAVTEREVLAIALAAALRGEFGAMVRTIETLPPEQREGVVRSLVAACVRQDLLAAGRVAQALPPGPLLSGATAVAAQAMLAHDPAVAVAWALASTSAAVDDATRRAVADGYVARDPRAALEQFGRLPAAQGRNQLITYAAADWVVRDATAALAWVPEVPAGDVRTRVLTAMIFSLAQTEPERAVAWANLLAEGRDRWLVLGAIAQTWVARNADQAWTWARALPGGAARESALAGIEAGLGGARLRRNLEGLPAGGGMRPTSGSSGAGGLTPAVGASAMPFGLDRDQALKREFEDALRESPSRAARWLAMQPVPDRRDELVEELARRWLAINPEAAQAWMDQTIRPPERREQLLREAGR